MVPFTLVGPPPTFPGRDEGEPSGSTSEDPHMAQENTAVNRLIELGGNKPVDVDGEFDDLFVDPATRAAKRAKAEAEARAKAEAEMRARMEADARAKAEAKARAEA